MGWLGFIKERMEQWVFTPLEPGQVPEPLQKDAKREAIEPDTRYLNVTLKSIYVRHVRKGLAKFFGTVHSSISVPHLGGTPVDYNVITTPSDLKDIDAENLARIVQIDRTLLEDVPCPGGAIDFEVGLFSIKSADLAAPFLNLLEDVSNKAGVGFLTTAMPFVPILKNGFDLLTGGQKENTLEIGVSADLNPRNPITGYYMLMAAPKEQVKEKVRSWRLDTDYTILDESGSGVTDYPYMVFSITGSDQKGRWFEIPEIQASYQALLAELKKGDDPQAEDDALGAFRRTVRLSLDLISADKERLVKQVEDMVAQVAPEAKRKAAEADEEIRLPDIQELALY